MSKDKVYPEGLLGRKLGMTQIFTNEGECIPVTAVQLGPCYVLDVKSSAQHGYDAVRLGFGPRKFPGLSKAAAGQFKKAGKGAFTYVEELRCNAAGLGWDAVGKEVKVADVFSDGDLVDISGVSIGRGFSGVVRRYKVKGQPSTRGTHEYRRHIGAVGCRKFPGRIFKNQRMPGRHGNDNVTIQNLKVVAIDPEENVMLVRGGIPGAGGGLVVVRKAVKGYEGSKAA